MLSQNTNNSNNILCVIVWESLWICTQQVDITPYYMCFVLISLWRVSQHPLYTHNINMKRVKMAHEQILSTDPDTHLCFRAFWFASFSVIAIDMRRWIESKQVSTTIFLCVVLGGSKWIESSKSSVEKRKSCGNAREHIWLTPTNDAMP